MIEADIQRDLAGDIGCSTRQDHPAPHHRLHPILRQPGTFQQAGYCRGPQIDGVHPGVVGEGAQERSTGAGDDDGTARALGGHGTYSMVRKIPIQDVTVNCPATKCGRDHGGPGRMRSAIGYASLISP